MWSFLPVCLPGAAKPDPSGRLTGDHPTVAGTALALDGLFHPDQIPSLRHDAWRHSHLICLDYKMQQIALEDKEYLDKVVNNNHIIKKWFEEELKKLDINVHTSEGNFSFIETSKERVKTISTHLMSEGILVRRLDSYDLPNCLRITIGTKEEMEATIQSLKKLQNDYEI